MAAQNHAQTVDYLFETVSTHSTITGELIQHINAMLLYGVCPAPMFLPTNQACEQPEHLTVQIRELTDYIAHGSVHPVLLAAVVHYNMVRIHPFDDERARCKNFDEYYSDEKRLSARSRQKRRKTFLSAIFERCGQWRYSAVYTLHCRPVGRYPAAGIGGLGTCGELTNPAPVLCLRVYPLSANVPYKMVVVSKKYNPDKAQNTDAGCIFALAY
ncbi:Fic family protein [Conchiformibius steedae]|nr:Fic family protein [Conchiformibius steedae]